MVEQTAYPLSEILQGFAEVAGTVEDLVLQGRSVAIGAQGPGPGVAGTQATDQHGLLTTGEHRALVHHVADGPLPVEAAPAFGHLRADVGERVAGGALGAQQGRAVLFGPGPGSGKGCEHEQRGRHQPAQG